MKWIILAAIFLFISQLKNVKFSVTLTRFEQDLISQLREILRLPFRPRDIKEPERRPELPSKGDCSEKIEPRQIDPPAKEKKRRRRKH